MLLHAFFFGREPWSLVSSHFMVYNLVPGFLYKLVFCVNEEHHMQKDRPASRHLLRAGGVLLSRFSSYILFTPSIIC